MTDFKKLLDSLIASTSLPEGAIKDAAAKAGDMAGTAGGIAGSVFGQATDGLKDAAAKANEATGASDKIANAKAKAGIDFDTSDLFDQAKGIVRDNKVQAGLVLGGLGALMLGTEKGRRVTGGAAKIGGAALIGGLAYQAFQNYKDGKPLVDLGSGEAQSPLALPAPSTGFALDDQSEADSKLYLRAMIAAAAADAKISEDERNKITFGLREAGMDSDAAKIIEAEFNQPASIEELAAGAGSPEVASQVYTAARLTIEPDTEPERSFLINLAAALNIEPELAAHLDAESARAKA